MFARASGSRVHEDPPCIFPASRAALADDLRFRTPGLDSSPRRIQRLDHQRFREMPQGAADDRPKIHRPDGRAPLSPISIAGH